MPQYRVLGSDEKSGEAIGITLTADNKQDAKIAAQKRGIKISTIKDYGARNRDTVEPPKAPEKKKLKLDEQKRAKKPAKPFARLLALVIIIIILAIIGWLVFANLSPQTKQSIKNSTNKIIDNSQNIGQ